MGVELKRMLQTKDFPFESIALPDQYLNFRTPIAHVLAHWSGFWVPCTHLAQAVCRPSFAADNAHMGDNF